ncbi:MAG: helix-turn-helix transcriptional regulator [Clostridiales bacterium]|nr:helix-turn-helix transcriptional regulator [Clostridiales bacterium]
MSYNQKALGLKISRYRELKNLSQKQLAELSGVSSGYISNIESGIGKSVNLIKLSKIADALNVEIDDLLCDSLIKLQTKPIDESNISEIDNIVEELNVFSDKQIEVFYKMLMSFINYKNKL